MNRHANRFGAAFLTSGPAANAPTDSSHGKATVTTCPLELAELYRDRLQSCGLTATIEPA